MQHVHTGHTAQSYQLPLVALLERMHSAQASLSLRAILPPSVPVANLSEGQETIAELSFEQGKITHCRIYNSASGHVLMQQSEALHALHDIGVLLWQVHPQQDAHMAETTPLPALAASNNTEVPVRVPSQAVPVEQVPLATLPLRVRHIFLLSNGQRTPQDIARMLHLPLHEVERVIQILHKHHLTTWQLRAS